MTEKKAWTPLDVNSQRRTEPFRQTLSDNGCPFAGYVIRWAYEDSPTHWVDFAVFDVVGCTDDGPCYLLPGWGSTMDSTQDIEQAGPMVEGFVKWDGCTQFSFPDGVHIDSLDDMADLFAAIEHARRVAMVEIIAEKQMEPREYP